MPPITIKANRILLQIQIGYWGIEFCWWVGDWMFGVWLYDADESKYQALEIWRRIFP